MTDLPSEAITAAASAVKARHTQISGTVIEYDDPEFRADIITALAAAAGVLRDQGATTERQAIIQLAVAKNAVCGGRPSDPDLLRSFAAVLHETRDQPQPTTTQEPT